MLHRHNNFAESCKSMFFGLMGASVAEVNRRHAFQHEGHRRSAILQRHPPAPQPFSSPRIPPDSGILASWWRWTGFGCLGASAAAIRW